MRFFSLSSSAPPKELAADESLLLFAENQQCSVFRIWEFSSPCVVLGRGSKFSEEVFDAACASDGVDVLRRTSGGASILAGPGCLMYSLVLNHEDDPRLSSIDSTHRFVLSKVAKALNDCLQETSTTNDGEVVVAGTSDLGWESLSMEQAVVRKFSGNSMRRGRSCTLYHGTILYDFDLDLIGRYLRTAPRQPEYRSSRDHGEFVTNLPLDRRLIVDALCEAWQPGPPEQLPTDVLAKVDELVRTKYSQDDWNRRH